MSPTARRWLFIVLMLAWVAALAFVVLGFGFLGLRAEAVAILVLYLALPFIAYRGLISTKP